MPGTARRVEVRIMSYNIRHTGEKSDTGVKHWDARKTSRKSNFEPTYNGFGKTENALTIDHIYYLNAKPVRFRLLDGKDYGVEYTSPSSSRPASDTA